MKNLLHQLPLGMILLLISFFSCVQEDHHLTELQGTIRFGGISLEFAPMGSPGSRVTGTSTWVHVFPNSANLVFINKATGQEYVLEYNPNDFSTPYTISLPYGAFAYHTIVEGGIFSAFLPFEARGEFSLDSQNLEISMEAATEYGLVTVKDQYVENASLSDGEKETNLMEHEDGKYSYLYVKGGTETTLNIKESFQGSTISRDLDIAAYRHYNFVLKLNEGTAAISELIMAPFELEEEEIILGSGSAFYEENGTIKCPTASPGDKGMVNDKVYEAVDRALLIQRRNEGADLSCVCTSLVTNMSSLFEGALNFNQPIGNWDVSKVTVMDRMLYSAINFNQSIENWDTRHVTDMSWMFYAARSFNQPLGNWNVGKVTGMSGMFSNANLFNQPIGNWEVSKVENMSWMFSSAISFNQPIENWEVSNVTNMRDMFQRAKSFNQPIGNWNVGNVTNMRGILSWTDTFNQPIGNWDVGNVTNMTELFYSAISFNQPIGNWNVSKVTNMTMMFRSAINFNQPIGNWDVRNVRDMRWMFFSAKFFNQPIGNWDVGNVTNMRRMFHEAKSFNRPLRNWDVSNVTDMYRMFFWAINFDQPIGDWNVSNVTNMGEMFYKALKFNQDLRIWCVQNIPSEPSFFSTETALLATNIPVWGTCPE